jgi:chromosomal replication initiation ATPase DnaA
MSDEIRFTPIAGNFTTRHREEARRDDPDALRQIITRAAERHAVLTNSSETAEALRYVADKLEPNPDPQPVQTRAEIVREVAAKHGLTAEQLRLGGRKKKFAWPRHEAIWRMRQVRRPDGSCCYSFPQCARAVGLTDHTSAIHAERSHAERLVQGLVK